MSLSDGAIVVCSPLFLVIFAISRITASVSNYVSADITVLAGVYVAEFWCAAAMAVGRGAATSEAIEAAEAFRIGYFPVFSMAVAVVLDGAAA